MKTAYIDCSNGISGNSILGALFDCGLPFNKFEEIMHNLLSNDKFTFMYEINECLEMKATFFDVDVSTDNKQNRNLEDIVEAIQTCSVKQEIKEKSIEVFQLLAKALAAAHQCELNEVVFHERNAIDTMIDVVGVCWGFDYFNIEHFISSPLHLGSGNITVRFGTLSIPAPATQQLVKEIPSYQTALQGELVTPTGAAIIKAFVHKFANQPKMDITHLGYGAPLKDMPYPGWIKLTIGSEKNES